MHGRMCEQLQYSVEHSAVAFSSNEPEVPAQARCSWKQWTLLTFLFCCVSSAVVDSFTQRRLEKAFTIFLVWVEKHPGFGVLAVILIYIISTICFVPGSLLTIGSAYALGSAFSSSWKGIVFSLIAVFLGASLGSICSFLLGRYVLRKPVIEMARRYPVMTAVDRALEKNGFKIMVLLRLSPLIPYNALDYVSGVTSISLRSYILSMVGLLPGAATLCYIGATASSFVDGKAAMAQNQTLRGVAIIGGAIFAIAGVAVTSYYSKIELDRILSEQDSELIPDSLIASPASVIDDEDDGYSNSENVSFLE